MLRERPAFHDVLAAVTALAALAISGMLIVMGKPVPEWWPPFVSAALAYVFGRATPGQIH